MEDSFVWELSGVILFMIFMRVVRIIRVWSLLKMVTNQLWNGALEWCPQAHHYTIVAVACDHLITQLVQRIVFGSSANFFRPDTRSRASGTESEWPVGVTDIHRWSRYYMKAITVKFQSRTTETSLIYEWVSKARRSWSSRDSKIMAKCAYLQSARFHNCCKEPT